MHAYRVVSIEKTAVVPHANSRAGTWYKFVITNGINQITGYRCGILSDVHDYLGDVVHRLNRESNLNPSHKKYRHSIHMPCFAPEKQLTAC